MDGLTSHRNDCLSDKFNRRFLEMMWSHTHILARLPVYHLKCWQIATINPKRKRTLTSEVATVVRDGESIQMKLQLTLEQHRFELRGSMQIFFNKHSRPPPVLHPWIQHTADRKQYFRIPNRRFQTADSLSDGKYCFPPTVGWICERPTVEYKVKHGFSTEWSPLNLCLVWGSTIYF